MLVLTTFKAFERDSAQSLIEKSAAIGQRWLKGIGSSETLMRPRLT
ncbi:MAG: hypothetical protein ABI866_04830 [Dokdonella sp.]